MWFSKDPMGVVKGALTKRGAKFAEMNKETIISGYATDAGQILMVIRLEPDKKTLLFVYHPVHEPVKALESLVAGALPYIRVHASAGHSAEQVAKACEYLLHQNYQLALGAFERDPADGEIRFHIALPYRDANPTTDQIEWCMDIGMTSTIVGVQGLLELLSVKGPAAKETTDAI